MIYKDFGIVYNKNMVNVYDFIIAKAQKITKSA